MKEDLKRKAIDMTKVGSGLKGVWIYEESSGISVYGEGAIQGGTYITTIPVSTIRAYLKRLDKNKS